MTAENRHLAHRLAYAGLLPFVLGCLLIWLVVHPEAHAFISLALSAYAALIISFLGGIQWGLSFARGLPLRPSLIWGIAASLLGVSDWLTLRFRLTLVASLSCFLAAAGS
jgi:hypothetical protein